MRLLPRLRKFRFAQYVLAAGLCLEGPSWCYSQKPQLSFPLNNPAPHSLPAIAPPLEDDPSEVVIVGGLTAALGEPSKVPVGSGPIQLVQDQPPVEAPPVQPPPVQPPPVQPPPGQATSAPLGRVGGPPPADVREAFGPTPGQSNAVGNQGGQALALGATDAGSLLGRSTEATGVETQKRSPIANETIIHGEHLGQISTWSDGQYWFPARQDLDTFLSKIDSGAVKDMIVTKGPYTAHLGPGLSFLDIQTASSPRYQDGFDWDGRTTSEYKNNGHQFYARQFYEMGSTDWGAYISYGQRTGQPYETGDHGPSFAIPAQYDSRDLTFGFGMDFSKDSHVEVSYMRLDQTDLGFPGQIFDTSNLMTYAFNARYTLENQDWFDRFTVDGWYNRTTLHGNAQSWQKRVQIPELGFLGTNGLPVGEPPNSLNFIGTTDIDLSSTGYRAALGWGKAKEVQVTVGTDLRWINQTLNEFDNLFANAFGLTLPCGNQFNFPIPPSQEAVFGVFAEYVNPVDENLTVKMEARGDYVFANIDGLPAGTACTTFVANEETFYGTTDTDRNYALWLAYATADYKLNQNITLTGGIGHSERPPTLTELYPMEPFLAILQQGFTTVQGNPELKPEDLYQVDLGFHMDYDRFRAGLAGYYSFIHNYITYAAVGASSATLGFPPSLSNVNALTVKFVNTDLATLAGFDGYAEVDATPCLTPFATVNYVSGMDWTRDSRGVTPAQLGINNPNLGSGGKNHEPLPMIPPLEARLGIRFHEQKKNPRWGVELMARYDARQDQVAASLGELPSAGFVVWDLRGYWRAYDGVLLTAGIENLFDKFYREHLDLLTGNGVFQPGQTIYAGVELRY